jgi:hypothetical protein
MGGHEGSVNGYCLRAFRREQGDGAASGVPRHCVGALGEGFVQRARWAQVGMRIPDVPRLRSHRNSSVRTSLVPLAGIASCTRWFPQGHRTLRSARSRNWDRKANRRDRSEKTRSRESTSCRRVARLGKRCRRYDNHRWRGLGTAPSYFRMERRPFLLDTPAFCNLARTTLPRSFRVARKRRPEGTYSVRSGRSDGRSAQLSRQGPRRRLHPRRSARCCKVLRPADYQPWCTA